MRVLIAPDKFKGSLSAVEVAAALASGLRSARPDVEIDCCPIADGGEGTVDAAVSAGFDRVDVTVSGPAGGPVRAAFARRADTAVIELATASGLHQLAYGALAPLSASSRGTGELMAAALDAGARRIVLGLGGSACTDGGAGLLQGLGARLLDSTGADVAPGGAALRNLDRIELTGLHPGLRDVEIAVACDVDNPLLGASGAAAVYAPQKGATRADVDVLDAALTRWADVVAAATGHDHRGAPGAGAAGGVAFAALALLGATLRSGAELVLDLVGFADRVQRAELVITGEGSLDAQTLNGKGPLGVAAAAGRLGIPVAAVAGRVELDAAQLARAGLRQAYTLADLEPDRARSIQHAQALLAATARTVAADWLGPRP